MYLGEILGDAPTLENVDKRLQTLETLHYKWAPVILVGLIGGFFWWRGRQ